MALFSQCNCDDSNGTDLNAHNTGGCSPHLAATWARQTGVTANAAVFAANRARASTSNAQCRYYSSGTPADADYSVYVELYVASNTGRAGALGRADPASQSAYFARYNGTQWELAKIVAGTFTSLQTNAASLNVGQTYEVELRMVSTTISMFVDGVQIGTNQTDSGIGNTNNAGIFEFDAGTPSDSTGYHIEYFSANDTPGGGSSFSASTPATVVTPRRTLVGAGI